MYLDAAQPQREYLVNVAADVVGIGVQRAEADKLRVSGALLGNKVIYDRHLMGCRRDGVHPAAGYPGTAPAFEQYLGRAETAHFFAVEPSYAVGGLLGDLCWKYVRVAVGYLHFAFR